MNSDVLVIGNGPIGCIAAKEAAKSADTIIVGELDRPIQCAGLFSKTGIERLGLKEKEWVVNRVRGAKMYSPSGIEVDVDGKKPKALVVDRKAFDLDLLHQSQDAGVRYIPGRVRSIDDEVSLFDGQKIASDKKILATGTDYSLPNSLGLDVPKDFVVGGQYDLEVEIDPDFVEMYYDVPDFFSWIIPAGDVSRVGLAVRGNPRPYLDRFVKKLKRQGRLKSDKIHAQSFGVIPIHNPQMKTQYDGMNLVGDAAGHVKATTGGGVILGAIAAKQCLSKTYEKDWKRSIGRELKMHLYMYKILNKFSPKAKDRFFNMMLESKSILEEAGDMDMASKTIKSAFTNPKFLSKAIVNAPYLIADFLL